MVYATNSTMNKNNPLSLHSECHMYTKYRKNPKLYNPKMEYDYLVIRYSKNGVLGESRPCYHCIQSIQNWSDLRIRDVYYSTRTPGVIVKERVKDMLEDQPIHYCSAYRRRCKN